MFTYLNEYEFLYPLKLTIRLLITEIFFSKPKKLSAKYQNFNFSKNMITDTKTPNYYQNSYQFNFMDSFSLNVFTWEKIFKKYKLKDKEVKYLEIGCFEGRSSVFVLEQLKNTFCYFVDPFEQYNEMTLSTQQKNFKSIFDNFSKNIKEFDGRYEIHKTTSDSFFKKLNFSKQFDLVYIDGSHFSEDVYRDATNAGSHLQRNGIIIFDDFFWFWYKDVFDNPFFGITKFLYENKKQYKIIYLGDQLILRKK
tara:strand:- start:151 stop:903 length:753 start_codon:yes stop_codon:yes gene_type:complete